MKKYLSLQYLKEQINTSFLILFLLSVVNLIYMHYYFLRVIGLEIGCYVSSYVDNFFACLIDASFVLAVFWLITFCRLRLSLAITFVVTLLWSFCNVFYARFFHQYLSWSAIGQAGNLTDGSVTESMLSGFEPTDLYYIVAVAIFCWLYIRNRHKDIKKKSLCTTLHLWGISFVILLLAHALYLFHPSTGFVYELEKTLFTPAKMDSMWPNWTVFHKGFFRKLFIESLTRGGDIELTPEQEEEIKQEITDHSQRVTGRTAPDHVQNVVFILVESYLSVTSDLFIDGKEITPNLNRLKQDSTVYYNGHMLPNVSIGESSDGQLIYMAGLMPLHSEITVSRAKKKTLIGLPEQMKKEYPTLKSLTIIPTNPTLWEQQAMSAEYGFDKLYSMIEYQTEMGDTGGGFLTDKMIFSYAEKKDQTNVTPFFSLILTMSMHQPYNSYEEHGFHLTAPSLPQQYKNYLINCHFTDMQIGNYLQSLKDKGLYDNSLIVIVSDHDAHPRYLGMEGVVSPEIPIYIINGGVDKSKAWDGECNQLDVYTTLLDIMGVETEWRGLGHTLLTKDYKNSATQRIQEISDMIILGNYFKKNPVH